ncbi:MAG: ABC transporter permease [Acidobacteria bacterium]|nr:ABC transporter permease [Acidobacteriota bacterium]
MDTLLQDLRYGLRMLLKSPTFTFIAILTLALGIGANTAIFSIIYGIVLKPLPYKNPEELFWIQSFNPTNGSPPLPNTVIERYEGWRDRNKSFENLAAKRDKNFNVTFLTEPERVLGDQVTYNFFDTLGVKPLLGRFFLPEEDKAGFGQVVVLEESFWQEKFNSSPNIINSDLLINGIKHTIIGVAPNDDRLQHRFYVPLAIDKNQEILGFHVFQVIGRIKPNVTLAQTEADIKAIAKVQEEEMPNINKGWTVVITPVHEVIVKNVKPALTILMASVCLLLLISCANVANLILVRATLREKEVAVRIALGAGRLRLAQQFFIESLLLASVGGISGVLLAKLLLNLFVKSDLVILPRVVNIEINLQVLLFTLLVSILTGILLGLIPILQARKTNLSEVMKENSNALVNWRGRKISNIFVIGEIAISLVLLISSGLLIRSFVNMVQINPGFKTNNILTMQFSLPRTIYKTSEQDAEFNKRLIEQIKTLPGVEYASVSTGIPLTSQYFKVRFTVEGRPIIFNEIPFTMTNDVTPDYFQLMGITLLKGRLFDLQDNINGKKVVVLNQTAAEKLFPGQDPIGKRLTRGVPDEGEEPEWSEVIGIVNDIKVGKLSEDAFMQTYFPYFQYPGQLARGTIFLAVSSKIDPSSLTNAIRKEFFNLDKDLPQFNVKPLEQIVRESLTEAKFLMTLLGIFAGVALVLATIGIYGVLSYSVTQRTHEIGIRIALGAHNLAIIKMILKEGMFLTSIGLLIGIATSLALNYLLKSLLYGVSTTDLLTYFSVSLLLAGVSFLATYIPAHRATLVDPMVALRRE